LADVGGTSHDARIRLREEPQTFGISGDGDDRHSVGPQFPQDCAADRASGADYDGAVVLRSSAGH
jgi:hypothetical protein